MGNCKPQKIHELLIIQKKVVLTTKHNILFGKKKVININYFPYLNIDFWNYFHISKLIFGKSSISQNCLDNILKYNFFA